MSGPASWPGLVPLAVRPGLERSPNLQALLAAQMSLQCRFFSFCLVMPLGTAREGAPGAEGYMPFVIRSRSDPLLLEEFA